MSNRGIAVAVALCVLLGFGWLLLRGGDPAPAPAPTGTAPAAAARKDAEAEEPAKEAGKPWALRGTGSVEGMLLLAVVQAIPAGIYLIIGVGAAAARLR